MVTHIILWQLKKELSPTEKQEALHTLLRDIGGLRDLCPGIINYRVTASTLGTSTHDLILEASFDTLETFYEFQNDPTHLEVAKTIRALTQAKASLDFQDE